jgi:hypothetical protein
MKTGALSFRIDGKIEETLKKVAKDEHRSVSSQAALAIEQWLQDRGHMPAPKGGKR